MGRLNRIETNARMLNPAGFQLMRLTADPAIRLIILYGGSSSGKTYSSAQIILLRTLADGENSLVMRKVGATLYKSVYEDFKVACKQMGLGEYFSFKDGMRQIKCVNGARVDFGGLDDPEKIKGISNYKRVMLDEWSEFASSDFKQVRKRLRGRKGQQIITTFNPIKETHWIKKEIFDTEKWEEYPMKVTLGVVDVPEEYCHVKSMRRNSAREMLNPRTGKMENHEPDTILIQTTYLNNFWVVGSPDGTYGYYDEQCIADFERDKTHDPDYYNVYALGEWGVIRTGSEFFGSFSRGKHCGEVAHDPALPLHISIDSNVLPYITITYWQIDTANGKEIRQIGETCAATPDNSVRRAAKLTAKRLSEWGVDAVFIHGDASTRNANNIDDEKRSFLDLFIDTLQKEGIEVTDMVGTRNPGVALTGEFINAIFEGVIPLTSLKIGDNCLSSIEDYQSVQKDANGAILKTRVKNKITMQTYEEHGHITDTLRYVVVDLLRDEFNSFSNRRKRNLYARDGLIRFFNPANANAYTTEMVYIIPNIGGNMGIVHAKLCGETWHIVSAAIKETSSTADIKAALLETGCSRCIMECPPAYYQFVREVREELPGLRVTSEAGDIDKRIAATSDFVKERILFDPDKAESDPGYSDFMNSLLDYRKDSDNKTASAVISGFSIFAAKEQ